ncbi:hypothetical protein BH09VER1_BH09VER1_51670 [soil metagenome]
MGGWPDCDGIDGAANLCANQSNQPIEMIEADNPLEILRYGYVPDSGGPGRNRGGIALMREYRLLADEAVFTLRSDRRLHPPYGIQGGKCGTPSWTVLNPGPDQEILPVLPLEKSDLKKGDRILYIQSGGGGYGNPLERDPLAVFADVLDEKLTIGYASREYGVVISARTLQLDMRATELLRRKATKGKRAIHTAICAILLKP